MTTHTILIYLLNLSGGAGKNAVAYGNALAEAGNKVLIVCGNVKSPQLAAAINVKCELIELGFERSIKAPFKLRKAIYDTSPDTLFALGTTNAFTLLIARTLNKNPKHFILRETLSPSASIKNASWLRKIILRTITNISYKKSDGIISLTYSMKRELVNDWSVNNDKVSVVYNGVDIESEEAPQKTPHPPPTRLLNVARLTKQKDHTTFIRALYLLKTEGILFEATIVGEGPEFGSLQDLVKSLGLSQQVNFAGDTSDVSSYYKNSDFFVLSSQYEGFPNCLIEALSFGIPVISTRCKTGPDEIITPQVGYLAEVGDEQDLKDKIICALSNNFKTDQLLERAMFFSRKNQKLNITSTFEEFWVQ